MAERRMFAKTIIDSDAFIDMPLSTQALYFHLSMRADDDGFINNPKRIQRMIGCADDDLKVLMAKRFILPFDSGVVVIKHWKIHNYIRSDRYKPSIYETERSLLRVKENGSYTDNLKDGTPLGIPNGYQMDTQDRKEEGENKEGKDNSFFHSRSETEENFSELTDDPAYRRQYLGGKGKGVVFLSDEQMSDLLDRLSLEEFDRYVGIVADCELNGKPFTKKTHYKAILDMAIKDRKIKK